MYEETPKPLRNLARSEPLTERSRQMFEIPPEIAATKVNALPQACRDFLTQTATPAPTAPAPATLYTLSGGTYVLNGLVSDLTASQKNGILRCLNVPNGIRMVRVTIDNTNKLAELDVHFFNVNFLKEIAEKYDGDNGSAKMIFPISGGSRLRAGDAAGQVQVDSSNAPAQAAVSMENEDKPMLRLVVKPIGDYSTYTLALSSAMINQTVFDPLFAEINFKFRPGCFNANCAPDWETAPKPLPEPSIDYLAKDYESFRLTMIGAMSERVPGWQATSEADLDVTLLELFSAAADELSDYQDRVMNEAYFATARKRISLARHARLMDYHIHQGNRASTWLALEIEHDKISPEEFELQEGLLVWAGATELKGAKRKPVESAAVFTLRADERQTVHQLLNNIGLYTWSDSIPALKAGSTTADLKLYKRFYTDDANAPEAATDEISAKAVQDLIRNYKNDKDNGKIKYLLIQEHLNPTTGLPPGRDPSKRQLLKLLPGKAGAEAIFDPVTDEWLVRVRWAKKDALKRDYCFTIDCLEDNPDTSIGKTENISLFHGNLVEVFHGRPQVTIFREEGEILSRDPIQPLEFYYERTRLSNEEKDRWGTICRLPEKYLAYRKTLSGGDVPPISTLKLTVADAGGSADDWEEVPSLIHSDNGDESGDHFIVETDENRQSFIRFGNGVNGRELPKGSTVFCYYQYGEGLEGNVGVDSIVNFDIDSVVASPVNLQIRRCWNPCDVIDGKDIEPVAEIIRRVPEAYRARQLRAVTLADYVARAEEIEGVSRAAASYGWTGSWRTVRITLDPFGTNELSDDLRREAAAYLNAVRLIGEDIEIRPPKFVPLEIEVKLCAEPDVWIEDIKFILEQEFSTGWTPDGRAGFFHPDSWTFGQTLHASQIIGRAMQIKGVEHIISVSIKPWNSPFPASDSFTKMNHNEIIEVLSDPDFLDRGFISFEVKGGRQ